jgi:hypothetical protein
LHSPFQFPDHRRHLDCFGASAEDGEDFYHILLKASNEASPQTDKFDEAGIIL